MVFGHGSADYLVNSPATVAQAVMTALRLFQGEWFLDTTAGVPWLSQVMGRGGAYDIVIRQAIQNVQGVVALGDSYTSALDTIYRELTVLDDGIVTAYGAGGLDFTVPYGGYGTGPYNTNPYGS
jgi:hypothetical protein